MNAWPHDDRASLEKFYGVHELNEHGVPTVAWENMNLTLIETPYPMRLSWAPATVVHRIRCHNRVADSLSRILRAILDHYGLVGVSAARVDLFGGCYQYRLVGGSHSLSTHAWGAGIDLDPERNPRGKKWNPQTGLPIPVIGAFKAEGWTWGGDFHNPDPMHLQCAHE